MGTARVDFTVFTKPWKMPLPELGKHVRGLGFGGVELPVRPGYQVEPAGVAKGLPAAARLLGDFGLKIGTVAGPTDERTIAACAEAGVPIIRICVAIPPGKGYLSAIADCQREWEALVPILDRHGVALGIQNHVDRNIANSAQLLHAVGRFDPRHVCVVWDAAHTALQGENADIGLDLVWSHLRVVNFKNAYWKRATGWRTGRWSPPNWRSAAMPETCA
jgi:sugar phosphate isomerase/epimerase